MYLVCFSYWNLAAGGYRGSKTVGQQSSLQLTAVTRWNTAWKLPFQVPGAGQTAPRSVGKQSFKPHQGLSWMPCLNAEDLYLCNLLDHSMVFQNVCYHSYLKLMYSTYSLVTADTFFRVCYMRVLCCWWIKPFLGLAYKVKSQLFFNETSLSLSFEQFLNQNLPFLLRYKWRKINHHYKCGVTNHSSEVL